MLHEIETYQQLAEPYLHEICAACHATSAWLLRHDFNKRVATVIAEYESDAANVGEKRGEIIGEQYPEGLQSDVWAWLRSTKPQVMQFHTDALPQDSMEYFEYLEDDVKSVICFAVYSGAEIWGFVEVWDTRQSHDFTQAEIEAALAVVRRFEPLI
jgi:GAF domain-containing protein